MTQNGSSEYYITSVEHQQFLSDAKDNGVLPPYPIVLHLPKTMPPTAILIPCTMHGELTDYHRGQWEHHPELR